MAHLDKVAVWEHPDGKVSITYFDDRDMAKYGFTDPDLFIAWHIERLKPALDNVTPTIINKSDVTPADRKDRDCWSLKNGKIEVDPVKVVAKEQKKAERAAVLAKLKITEEELKKIL